MSWIIQLDSRTGQFRHISSSLLRSCRRACLSTMVPSRASDNNQNGVDTTANVLPSLIDSSEVGPSSNLVELEQMADRKLFKSNFTNKIEDTDRKNFSPSAALPLGVDTAKMVEPASPNTNQPTDLLSELVRDLELPASNPVISSISSANKISKFNFNMNASRSTNLSSSQAAISSLGVDTAKMVEPASPNTNQPTDLLSELVRDLELPTSNPVISSISSANKISKFNFNMNASRSTNLSSSQAAISSLGVDSAKLLSPNTNQQTQLLSELVRGLELPTSNPVISSISSPNKISKFNFNMNASRSTNLSSSQAAISSLGVDSAKLVETASPSTNAMVKSKFPKEALKVMKEEMISADDKKAKPHSPQDLTEKKVSQEKPAVFSNILKTIMKMNSQTPESAKAVSPAALPSSQIKQIQKQSPNIIQSDKQSSKVAPIQKQKGTEQSPGNRTPFPSKSPKQNAHSTQTRVPSPSASQKISKQSPQNKNSAPATAGKKSESASLLINPIMATSHDRFRGKPIVKKNVKNNESKMKVKEVIIPSSGMLVRDFASKLSLKGEFMALKLEELGEIVVEKENKMNSIAEILNRSIDADTAELIALDLGVSVKRTIEKSKSISNSVNQSLLLDEIKSHQTKQQLPRRSPIVTIIGHVDHGKTTLLDALRSMKWQAEGNPQPKRDKKKKDAVAATDAIAGTEAGGITQKLSAFSVDLSSLLLASAEEEQNASPRLSNHSLPKKILFLDTPGHAAFTTMREQGILATDIVVLVVALDDGVQPQTVESLKAVQQAKCKIIVALNKIDKLPNREERESAKRNVLMKLAENDLLAVEYGGDVQVVEVAGKTGQGLPALLSNIASQSEAIDLHTNFSGFAEGIVLEAKQEKGKGIVADVVIKWGHLKVGDSIVIGTTSGKIKSLINDQGQLVEEAFPGEVVKLIGLKELPTKGIELLSVESEHRASQIADRRIRLEEKRIETAKPLPAATSEPAVETGTILSSKLMAASSKLAAAKSAAEGVVLSSEEAVQTPKTLPTLGVLLKADSIGTLDALRKIIDETAEKIKEDLQLKVIHSSIGDLTAKDIDLCNSSGNEAVILAFNVAASNQQIKDVAKEIAIPIYRDTVIYGLEDALVEKLESLLPKDRLVTKEGTATVTKVFKMKGDKDKANVVAGVQVQTGYLRKHLSDNSKKSNRSPSLLKSSADAQCVYYYRVARKNVVALAESKGQISLKHFKEDVNEVEAGSECGLSLEGFTDFQVGDEIECFKVLLQAKKVPRLYARPPPQSVSDDVDGRKKKKK